MSVFVVSQLLLLAALCFEQFWVYFDPIRSTQPLCASTTALNTCSRRGYFVPQGDRGIGQGSLRQIQSPLHPRSTAHRRIVEGFRGIYHQRHDRETLCFQWIPKKHPGLHVRTSRNAQIRLPTKSERLGVHERRLVRLLNQKALS